MEHKEFFGTEADAVGIFAGRQVRCRLQRVPFTRAQDKPRTWWPSMNPASVRSFEETLGRAAVGDPRHVVLGFDVFGHAVRHDASCKRALHQ